ncbi:MAG: hypothetical protein A3J29_21065 [Acidobacteria bacterium RIFCSPLOWO2_12_FULL_67_14b]|nr:MAG: hypothetical protein A3J29_21065 [Acidobacteria bacterium RIFCSPLOWO2_12_FULL_67_14b]
MSLKKILIALVALSAVGYLFVRSARDARSEPYSVSAAHLRNWTLQLDTSGDADGPVVWLSPPPELPMNLFRQLFARQMESMGTPGQPGIPLALRSELPNDVAGEEVLALARDAGLAQATLTARCVGYRRVSNLGVTRQLYFVWFEVPGFDRFRQALAARAASGFAPNGLSPVLMMAAQPNFLGWMPVVVNQDEDCIAPVTAQ